MRNLHYVFFELDKAVEKPVPESEVKRDSKTKKEEKEPVTTKVDAQTYSKAFKDFITSSCSYKGMRWIYSAEGMSMVIDLTYTMEELQSRMDKQYIYIDGETFKISDYTLTDNQSLLVEAGVIYTTDSARSREKKVWDRVSHQIGEVGNMYYYEYNNKKVFFEHTRKLLTPNQCKFVLDQISRDTDLFSSMRSVNPGAATLFDFAVLKTSDGEHLVEYVVGAKFPEQVVSIMKITGPFTKEYDSVRDILSDKECVRWLMK